MNFDHNKIYFTSETKENQIFTECLSTLYSSIDMRLKLQNKQITFNTVFFTNKHIYRVPTIKSALLEKLNNSAEAFSPDGKWVLGKI